MPAQELEGTKSPRSDVAERASRNYNQVAEICKKHNIKKIFIKNTGDTLCRLCEKEKMEEENQKTVDQLAVDFEEGKRKYFLKQFSMMDETIRNASFDNFEISTDEEKRALQFAKEKARHWAKGGRNNIILQGDVGVGKSHLAHSILQAVSDYNKKIGIFVNVTILLNKIKSDINNREWYIRKLTEADYLVLDDLGTEMTTDWVREILYDIVNMRFNTIFTTNLTYDEIQKRYSKPFLSRMMKGVNEEQIFKFKSDKNKRITHF